MTGQAERTLKRHQEALIQTQILHKSTHLTSILSQVQFTDGSSKIYQTLNHAGAVAIVAFDNSHVYFVRQYRFGINQVLLEIPAGLMDQGEEPIQAAIRELQEEIGFHSHNIRQVKEIYSAPATLNEKIHIFFATDLYPSKLVAEDTDEIDTVKIPISTAISDEFLHQIMDAKTLVGLNQFKYYVKSHL